MLLDSAADAVAWNDGRAVPSDVRKRIRQQVDSQFGKQKAATE